ncbi:MAG: glycosyltransferase [Leptolyngbya sp. DLM2.Bin27]|nr:MAG: glycosyltransferase [Leptolyngbya sp. DLM2.Bin27]
MATVPTYSLVVPVFNEAENLEVMYRRVAGAMASLGENFELILIDDGSRDTSLQIMQRIHHQDNRVGYISLARNFGHQVAVTAGLQFAQGQAVIVLDADLQDPPELIPDLVAAWRQGYQVVYAQRLSRQRETWLKRVTAYSFYRLINRVADVPIPTDTGDFCLMDRQVVNVLNAMPERNRYLRGLRAWVGFSQTAVTYHRDPRLAGRPKYTFFKSFVLALDGMISLSRVPLKLATYLGLLTALLALGMIGLVLYWRFVYVASPLIGYALITIAVFFLGSVQLISIGILGEYVGRIYEEVKGRPLYTIRQVQGTGQPATPPGPVSNGQPPQPITNPHG